MKTIDLSSHALTLQELLAMAHDEPVILRTSEGEEYVIGTVEDFQREVELRVRVGSARGVNRVRVAALGSTVCFLYYVAWRLAVRRATFLRSADSLARVSSSLTTPRARVDSSRPKYLAIRATGIPPAVRPM